MEDFVETLNLYISIIENLPTKMIFLHVKPKKKKTKRKEKKRERKNHSDFLYLNMKLYPNRDIQGLINKF